MWVVLTRGTKCVANAGQRPGKSKTTYTGESLDALCKVRLCKATLGCGEVGGLAMEMGQV